MSCKGKSKETIFDEISDEMYANCGEDAYFVESRSDRIIWGVADGVGGWVSRGVDPSKFSLGLMKKAKENAKIFSSPSTILQNAYDYVQLYPDLYAGSSTACILSLDLKDGLLMSTNLGDSGYIVIREGKVIYRTVEQQHFFNAPFQLAVYPRHIKVSKGSLIDKPTDGTINKLKIIPNDVIIVGTDGFFDNVFDEEIVKALESIWNRTHSLESVSNYFVRLSHEYGHDVTRMSPFGVNALKHDGRKYLGGKPDDVTIITMVISEEEIE